MTSDGSLRRNHRMSSYEDRKVEEEKKGEVNVLMVDVVYDDMEDGEILEDKDGGFGAGAGLDCLEDGITKDDCEIGVEIVVSNNKNASSMDEKGDTANNNTEKGEIHQSGSFGRDRELLHSHGEYGRRLYQDDGVRSRSPVGVSWNETVYLESSKRKIRDDADSVSSYYDLERHSESRDSRRKHFDNKKISASPESFRENYKSRERSPVHNNHHGEAHQRGSLRSSSHLRETSWERDRHTSHVNSSDSQGNMKIDSDNESGAFYDRFDPLGHHDTESCMEKVKLSIPERKRSSSSCDVLNDRHGRHDRYREKDQERESKRKKETNSERGRERCKERGKERDREHERDRDRDRNKDREDEQIKNIDREIEKDRMREKEIANSQESVRYSSRDSDRNRNRKLLRERERDRSRHMEKNRIRDQDRCGDSRNSRHDESENYRDKKISKESTKRMSCVKYDRKDIKEKPMREENQEDYQEKIEKQLAKEEEEDPAKIIEESIRRRQAILDKYKKQQLQQTVKSSSDSNGRENGRSSVEATKTTTNAPLLVALEENRDFLNPKNVSAAEVSFSMDKSPWQNETSTLEKTVKVGLGYVIPESERSTDIFSDDIFGDSPTGVQVSKEDNLTIERSGLHDNWDDAEGYYNYRFGEVLDGRYEVIAAHGKGVFSTVVRAKDHKAGSQEVAIKIIRNNDTMYKAGLEELVILKKLAGADPEDKRHCVRFISSFKYRNHLCLVFESLHMNLREVLKKFGRNIGLKLTAVRAYAKQLFIALKHLRNCGVLHCDIKPDNMLVNDAKNVLKLCDFGNAMFAGKNEITPYLVSRFYRSPEIILGLPYDHPMDMWSIGCCLFELYNGKVLFPGSSNNDMLRLHMELKGSFPKKMLRKGGFTNQHFDRDLNFHATEEDPVTKKAVKRLLLNIKPKDLCAVLTSFPEDPKLLAHFKDLLDRMFMLDPEKRLTVSQALNHPFITSK